MSKRNSRSKRRKRGRPPGPAKPAKKQFKIKKRFIALLGVIALIWPAYQLFNGITAQIKDYEKEKIKLENADVWFKKGEEEARTQNYRQALIDFNKALGQQVELHGEKSKEAVLIRYEMGLAYSGLYQYGDAVDEFTLALSAMDGLNIGRDFMFSVNTELAQTYILQYDFTNAERVITGTLDSMTRRETEEMNGINELIYRGWLVHKMNGQVDGGMAFSTIKDEDLDISPAVVQFAVMNKAINGLLELKKENYTTAIYNFEQILSINHGSNMYISEKYFYDDIIFDAIIYSNIGLAYFNTIENHETVPAWTEVNANFTEGFGEKPKTYQDALKIFQDTHEIFEGSLGSRNIHTAYSHLNLANVYRKLEDFPPALRHSETGIDILEYFSKDENGNIGKNDSLAAAYDVQASILRAMGESDGLEELYKKSIGCYVNRYSYDLALTFYNYAGYLIESGRPEDAAAQLREAKAIVNVIGAEGTDSLLANIYIAEMLIR